MGTSPLEDPRLRLIDERLDAGRFEEAEHLLAALSERETLRPGPHYLVTRLLYQRGQLGDEAVAQRLADALREAPDFPEARAMLDALRGRELLAHPSHFVHATTPPSSTPTLVDPHEPESWTGRVALPHIPRPPGVPSAAQIFVRERPASIPPSTPGLASAAAHDTVPPSSTPTVRPPRSPRASELGAGLIRSVRPSIPEEEDTPTALSVAALLDDGEPERALSILAHWGRPLTPELLILRARGYYLTGRRTQALTDLDRVARAPLIEPELRASSARLFVDMDELARAVEQARRAHEDDPAATMVRLTLALALVRAARRRQESAGYAEAEPLLASLRPRATPLPGLVHGLRACVQSVTGDPERAVATAQLSIDLDPRGPDALAALALASARLGLRGDVERAFVRLQEIDRVEARALAPALEAAGVAVDGISPSSHRVEVSQVAELWDPIELDLVKRRRQPAIAALDRLCLEQSYERTRNLADHDLSALSEESAAFFTCAPVFRHFAPFDLSLGSANRVEAALGVLYGTGALASPRDGFPLTLFLGAYVGECVRRAFDGRWRGTLSALDHVAVEVSGEEYAPFESAAQRLELGRSLRLDHEVLAHPAAEPHAQGSLPDIAPPAPWDPLPWPAPEQIGEIGRALCASVVHLYTSEFAGGPLDGSLASLRALDQYVNLLAPATSAPQGDAAWVRRAAAVVGSYLIEVLRENVGARLVPQPSAVGPRSYELVLRDGSAIHPVQQAYDRLSGRRMTPLSEYASRLSRRV